MNHLIFTSTLINGYRVQTTYYVIVTANSENRKLQKYFWKNVIVLQKKKSKPGVRKLNPKQEC